MGGAIDERVARAVREGLSGPVKALPAWLAHDGEGARLLDRLTRQPTWYPARAERFLLDAWIGPVLEAAGLERGWGPRIKPAPERIDVIEVGPCTATRSRPLVARLARKTPVRFIPVDASPAVALRLLKLASEVPDVEIRPRLLGDGGGLASLGTEPSRKLVLLLGGVLGALPTAQARALLASVRTCVGPDGALLLGVDHNRDRATLRAAYADPEGVAAALNRNVLARLNRELGAGFDVGRVRHQVRWCPTLGGLEVSLEFTRRQDVFVDALDMHVRLAEGERIRTAWCTQHDTARLDSLLASAALARVGTWLDPTGRFAVHVARAR